MQFLLKEDGFKLLQETGDRLILARTIVTPKVGLQGADILTLYIESEDGAFDGTSVASFSGTGIIVNSTTLVDATHVKVSVSIDPGATLSARDVTITTGIVVVFAPGLFTIKAQGATTSATAAFQYTLLTRGNDIRRNPGISIKDVLNNTPNVCAFTVDGSSNTPVIGEKIEIRDSADGDRLLFAGTVQSIEQVYEGLIDQLAWNVQAIDFTWLLNRKRPFGSYQNVSASVIVKELIANYAPGFTTLHVQTSLAKVTAIFDGSDDLVTVLTKIAAAIGGGHWYVDYNMDVHFFHIKPVIELPPSEFESLDKHITLTLGAPVSTAYPAGFYFLRHTFLYSDGSESKLGAISNVVHSHGTERMVLSTIPLGSTRGSLTCVGRRIYYNQFLATQAKDKIETIVAFCQINDNVTEAFSTNFGAQGADNAAVVEMVVLKTYTATAVPAPAGYVKLSDQAARLAIDGNTPVGTYSGLLEEPTTPTILQTRVVGSSFGPPGTFRFLESWITGGVETSPGPVSNAVALGGSKAVDFSNVLTGPGGTTKRRLYFQFRLKSVDVVSAPPPAAAVSSTGYSSAPQDGITAGTYSWATTYTMLDGRETLPSALTTLVVSPPPGFPYAQHLVQVNHTGAPTGACFWNVYRTTNGGGTLKLAYGRMGISGINSATGEHYSSGGLGTDGRFDVATDAHLGADALFADQWGPITNFGTLFENALTSVTKGMNGDGITSVTGPAGPGAAMVVAQSATNDFVDWADIPGNQVPASDYTYVFTFSNLNDHTRETAPSPASAVVQTPGHALLVECPCATVETGINFVWCYRTVSGNVGNRKLIGVAKPYISRASALQSGNPGICAEFIDITADGALGQDVVTAPGRIPVYARGWMGFKGTTWLSVTDTHPPSGVYVDGNVVYFASTDVALVLETIASIVPVPTISFTGHPAGPSAAPSASVNLITNTAGYFNGNWLQFKVAFLYRDGTVSFPSPASAAVGTRNMVQGTGVIGWNLNNVPIGLIINDNDVVARFVYWSTGLLQTPNYSVNYLIPMGGLWPIPFLDPTWADSSVGSLVIIPNNTETSLLNFSLASLDATYSALPGQVGAVVATQLNKPYNTGTILSVDPIPVWPNPDGPSLEDVDPPDPITNANVDLLHGESGSQPFSVFTDLSQVRNRIYVVGSGSSCLLTAAIGDLQIQVGDISNFSPNGGKIKVEDPATGQHIIIRYNGVAGVPGATFITLALALDRSIPQGSLINNFFQADDTDSQRLLARAELDANGNPTDGIHEYTIVDGSLKALFQLYMRAYAELELFSKPIITIKYATRDPKSRSGQTVHVDMTNPPCKGDFLIQEVTIDQIHDESDVLTPRYTVSASSVKFELNDLLLQILGGKVGGGASSGGIAVTSISTVNTQTNTILIAQYTLSQSQLSALLTTPVEILSAPGAGKIIVILFCYWHTNEPASFTSTTNASLRYGVTAGGGGGPAQNDISAPASITAGGVPEFRWTQNALSSGTFFDLNTPAGGGGTPVNKSIYIKGASNAGAGGAGASCAITIAYMVIDAT